MQTEQLLCWSGMTNTELSTTSGSNEEEGVSYFRGCIFYSIMAVRSLFLLQLLLGLDNAI